ncbi:MAG: HPr family phosphocarrier protein [Lachnospiraceae bacterium]|jgi:phosphocarrier protein HPr|nr:HPr family phosphocarrier protein [Lachnospiraceae bacterium]
MKTFSYEIKDEIGIHARPAGLLVKEAKKYSSKIVLTVNGKNAEATKLMAIMSLGVKQGQTVEITVEGADEDTACENIKAFFEQNL